MRRFRSGILPLLIAALGIVQPSPSASYNDDGHFFTVAAIAALQRLNQPDTAKIDRDEMKVIAFCALIPDLASELDATELYTQNVIGSKFGWTWDAFGACWPPGIPRMVTAHYYIHALTDSAAAPVTDAAVAIIKRLRSRNTTTVDANRACAVGLAVHLLGDSFAHRRLSEPDKTYGPGRGHADDRHRPDYMSFNSVRAGFWALYLRRLAEALGIAVDPDRLNALGQVATKFLGGDEYNKFNTEAITNELLNGLSDPLPNEKDIWAPYSPRLDQLYKPGMVRRHFSIMRFNNVVARYRKELPGSIDYRTVWKTYMETAVDEFNKQKLRSPCEPEKDPL